MTQRNFWALFLAASLVLVTGAARAQDADITISVSPDVVDLSKGETATFSFQSPDDGQVQLRILGPDWREVARVDQENIARGSQVRIAWDGTDIEGAQVADEAYFPILEFTDTRGGNILNDPSLSFQHGSVLVLDVAYDAAAGGVRFKTEIPTRVTLYAGLDGGGPLLNTLLSAVPFPAGEHFLPWDGMDQSGVVKMVDLADFKIFASGQTLWAPGVIIRGADQEPYPLYTRALSEMSPIKPIPDINEIGGRKEDLPQPEDVSPEPVFALSLAEDAPRDADGVPLVKGEVLLSVALDPKVRIPVLTRRFEIVLFANYAFQTEVEEGRSPATVVWDATKAAPGDYILTVNVATLPGQLSAASLLVRLAE